MLTLPLSSVDDFTWNRFFNGKHSCALTRLDSCTKSKARWSCCTSDDVDLSELCVHFSHIHWSNIVQMTRVSLLDSRLCAKLDILRQYQRRRRFVMSQCRNIVQSLVRQRKGEKINKKKEMKFPPFVWTTKVNNSCEVEQIVRNFLWFF